MGEDGDEAGGAVTSATASPVDHRYDPATGQLEVAVEGVRVVVDPHVVLPVSSPDGNAHACFWRWWMVRKMTPMIRCVILPGDS